MNDNTVVAGTLPKVQYKKLPKGQKYTHAVATTLTGPVAKQGRILRERYAVSLATVVRQPVITAIRKFYEKVQLGQVLVTPVTDILCQASKRGRAPVKLHVTTNVDGKTASLIKELRRKGYVCIAPMIRPPVANAIRAYYNNRVVS